jgi:glycosyltransferase involved in cell wall biosynthesis
MRGTPNGTSRRKELAKVMKIAQVAPLYEAVPPHYYGGTERVVAALCDALVDSGHDVTLYAAGESVTRAKLHEVVPAPLRTRMSRQELIDVAPHIHLRALAELFRDADFDVIHSHLDIWALPFAAVSSIPTVTTMHGRLDLPMLRSVLGMYPDLPLVSISDAQRRPLDGLRLNWLDTVPHGLDLSEYLQQPRTQGDHLVFAGRVCPEKGLDTAITVARRCGRSLHIAAKVDPLDIEYFESRIDPLLGDDIVFLGEIGEDRKPSFFADATATLFPINWPEPFGIVMVESLAAGTPVIALRHGSVPEVLVDGVTGFICDTVDQLIEAVGRVGEIDPEDCRRHARQFSPEVMGRHYVGLYEEIVGREARLTPTSVG